MQELTTRIQGVEAEISSLRRAIRRLREICTEADRIRAHCEGPAWPAAAPARPAPPAPAAVLRPVSPGAAAAPRPLVLRQPVPPRMPPAMPERIAQALHADNFLFRSAPAARAQAERKG